VGTSEDAGGGWAQGWLDAVHLMKERKRPCGDARPGMRVISDDVCGGCQRPCVRAEGSGANSGRADGVRLCCLYREAIEHGRH
jgi:hypothetical protein